MRCFGSWCVRALAFVWTVAPAKATLAADLAWHTSVACDERDRVRDEVERLVGQPLEAVEFADFAVDIHELPDRRVELQLAIAPRNPALHASSRTLVAGSCRELAEASALAIAMTVSAHQAEPVVEQAAPIVRVESLEEPPLRDPIRGELGASAALDVGAFPHAAVGAQVRVAVRYRWWFIAPFGVFFPRSRQQRDDGVGAEYRAAAGGALACAGKVYSAFTLDGCVGYEVGKLSGRGTGLRQPRAGDSLWSAPRAELQLGVPLAGKVRLSASAGVVVPTIRERFEIEGGLVHRPSPVTGRFGLGIDFGL